MASEFFKGFWRGRRDLQEFSESLLIKYIVTTDTQYVLALESGIELQFDVTSARFTLSNQGKVWLVFADGDLSISDDTSSNLTASKALALIEQSKHCLKKYELKYPNSKYGNVYDSVFDSPNSCYPKLVALLSALVKANSAS